MYKITYHYFKRAKNKFEPTGNPIFESVIGKTIKEINSNYSKARDNHDLFMYTQITFDEISIVKE